MDDEKPPIPISSHPAWKGAQHQPKRTIPPTIRGPIQSWAETEQGPWRALHIGVGPTSYTAMVGVFLMPRTENTQQDIARTNCAKTLLRARDYGHDVSLHLLPKSDGSIHITNGVDITESLLLNGPFGADRQRALSDGKDCSVRDFLKTAGASYGLSRAHVAQLWTWPTQHAPELRENLSAFRHLPPSDIDDTPLGQQGMAVALITGTLQKTMLPNSHTNEAVIHRLQSAQGRWDKLGSLAGIEGASTIADGAYHRLPITVGLASGLIGREEQDLTLARGAQTIWTHLRPGLLKAYTAGPLREVLHRAQTIDDVFAQSDGLDALDAFQQASKEALQHPERAREVLQQVSKSLGHPLPKEDTAGAFMTTYLQVQAPQRSQPNQER